MRPWILLAPSACALLTSACAHRPPVLPAAPQLQMPAQAAQPCELYRLPEAPTQADLEIGYAKRGAELVACDAARRLAVETHATEHALEAQAHKAALRSP